MATDAKGNLIFHGSTSVGLRNVGSYQVSGMPWVTGSNNLASGKVHMVEFPYVTKKITVMNTSPGPKDTLTGRPILIHFNSGSGPGDPVTFPGQSGEQDIVVAGKVISGFHYFPVLMSGSIEMNVKCKRIYISQLTGLAAAGYQVLAELTNIPTRSMPHLTGSGITE
jgi:hypothetical protein